MIVAFDYKSFHVLTLGFEAKDARYMRMARMDMHSFVAACGLLKIEDAVKMEELPDEELLGKLKWYRKQPKLYSQFGGKTFKEIRDEKSKRAILGVGFGQQAFSLYRLNPESFKSPQEAQLVLDELNALYPKPEQWRKDVRAKADRERQLVSMYGFVRRFWDVYRKKQVEDNYQAKGMEVMVPGKNGERWVLKPADDHEACIAFLPANDAFGMIRSRMVEMGNFGWDERYGFCNSIHDSVVFDCKPKLVGECLHVIGELLERPSEVLIDPEVAPGGLWCAAESKIGPDLAHMQEVDWKTFG